LLRDGCERLTESLSRGFICQQIRKNRYLDVGDWTETYAKSVVHPDPRSAAAVLVHEIVEKLLCEFEGISVEEVDSDDAMILKGKKKLRQCRYYKHHRTATKVERIICNSLKLDWKDHENNVDKAWSDQEGLLEEAA
jgi:hypothetical protein